MVVEFVHTMMCKPVAGSEGMHTRFIVIGTHRDLMHECDETLKQKNERLASLFLPALEENLVMNGDDIIFAVNAENPDENDDTLRSDPQESGGLEWGPGCGYPDSVPRVAERRELVRGRAEKEGSEHGGIPGHRWEAEDGATESGGCLVFFNHMSVWMYVPSVLPGAVFVDPQMPLDSINRIVQYSFRVGGGAIAGLAASECRLWKEGVVSSEMLKGEEFRGCFVRGLFEAGDALKLFEKLYIVAPLNEREFIMPAMLQTVAEKDMERYVPAPSEHVSPLFLHFHMSRIAKGVFCSTHTCMRSKYGWTTAYAIEKRKKVKVPACLFRNAVRLQHPKKPYKITLVHAVTHFAVYLTASQADLPSICPEIRDMLMDAVDSAASAFHFKKWRASVAFQCSCSPDDVHTATPNEAHSNLICSITGDISEGPLTPGQRVWLGPRTAPAAESTTTSLSTSEPVSSITDPPSPSSPSSRMDEGPTLPELLSFPTHSAGEPINIITKVGVNYEMLGTLLLEDNDGSIIPTIRSQYQLDADSITMEIMRRWLRGKGKQPVTWKTLTDSLKSIGLSPLASSIEHSLTSSS
ncbi:hypothetical protein GBAR_LOCUS19398 [Geodia barretti]|uniref:Death domain-containing protein n=1 Tax=Geodia barretti TaxID=519541 RepID=A0AA35SR69_GEOBA|nr:hypothetical protein GBAR_LOCUS19398 [Geodia barretti]